jgi:hypothetical protein
MIQLQKPKELVQRLDRFATIALRKDVRVPEAKLKEYVGQYTCFDHPSKVMLMEHQLVFEFPGTPYVWLFPASDSRFFLRTTPAEIEFARNGDKVAKMIIHNSDGSAIECPVRASMN